MNPSDRSDHRTHRARELRRDATPAERKLWRQLKQVDWPGGGHFRRQVPIGPYFADFAHHGLKLIVELDGDQHGFEEGLRRDTIRTSYLEQQGYLVLRFWNGELRENLDGVVATIWAESARHPPHPGSRCARLGPPHRKRGEGRALPTRSRLNLADILGRVAAFGPAKSALRFEGWELTYGGFAQRIDRAAAWLAHECRVQHGDRVALLALNHPDTLALLFGCARLGAMLVPLNWRLAAPELAYIVQNAEPALLVADGFPEVVAALASTSPDLPIVSLASAAESLATARPAETGTGSLSDPVLVVYTSGTTGRPKGAVLTQDALLVNAAMSRHMHGLTSLDHVLTVLPFFHVGGLNIQTVPALLSGATVTIHSRFTPDATLVAIERDRPSLTVLVPTTIAALLAEPGFARADLSSLRALTTGSTFVPEPLIAALEERGVPVLQVYGATETGPVSIYTCHEGERRRPGSTGWPGPYGEAKVVDDAGSEVPHGTAGEIWLRGPQILAGYWRDDAATVEALTPDGWFRTGDVATRDPDGAFTVHDRKKNVVISGGENIYPAEVERVLLTHPGIAEAAVVGYPDERWGEVPVACLVARPGHAPDAGELADLVRRELARFKAPRQYIFLETLPRSVLGKIQHALVRDIILASIRTN